MAAVLSVPARTGSKGALWTGRVLSGLAALFLLMDGTMKLVKPAPVVEASTKLGISEGSLTGIGLTLLVCTFLYLVPRTRILGAVLLTGYLGGAVATHVIAGGPAFNVVFPVLFGAFVWGGLYLRDERLRSFLKG